MNYNISDNQCERRGGVLDEMDTKSHYLAITEDGDHRIICKTCSVLAEEMPDFELDHAEIRLFRGVAYEQH
jgi:hypothetical protein